MTSATIADPNPFFRLVQLASGLWVSRALWAAAHFRIADAVGDGPRRVPDIARAAGCHEENLRRLMKALVSIGLFRADGPDSYAQSELSLLLKSDHPLSQRDFIDGIFGGEHFAGWGGIAASIRDGTTAFDSLHGQGVFDWYDHHPEEAQRFGRAMAGTTMMLEAVLLAVWTPPAFELAVDVGGSGGTLLASLLRDRPEARGILFDRPDVAETARERLGEGALDVVGGDFFESVPAGDLYVLKQILHDWDDERSAAILHNIRQAIRPGGRVAIIDALLPDEAGDDAGFLLDLNMMVMTGGRERSAADFTTLLERTGFSVENIIPTPTPFAIVQAVTAE